MVVGISGLLRPILSSQDCNACENGHDISFFANLDVDRTSFRAMQMALDLAT